MRNPVATTTAALLAPDTPLLGQPGIGPTTAARLGAAGLRTVRDLLGFFPRRYRELRELASPDEALAGELVRLRGTVRGTRLQWLPGRRAMVTVAFAAADGVPFEAPFFNQPWLRKAYTAGQDRVVEGRLVVQGRRFVLQQARILGKDAAPTGEVQLRYRDVDGVSGARLVAWIRSSLLRVDWTQVALPALPPGLREHDEPPQSLYTAMHAPATVAEHERARLCFALHEAVALFQQVERARRQRQQRPGMRVPVDDVLAARIEARIPFALTQDQRAAIAALRQQLSGPAPMGVLLQGDVGTGKTAVAVWAALAVAAHGAQVAFLQPTELLAEQQWAVVSGWLAGSDVAVSLLTAGQKEVERRALLQRLSHGGPQLVFGTHALLSDDAVFPRLGLVVIDEQHRFGVAQRMQLVHKGSDPHVLVMTATPIPRTLALSLFGDLDVVLLQQRPQGRRPVPARRVAPERWARVVRSIARAVRRGGRVFVVCPAVGEGGEKGGTVRLQAVLQDRFRTGIVHGRMPATERQAVLTAFRGGALDVLVGTTVLEVGVDVPDAVLIVVVAADRFGLATLHQLRGRVGRGRRRGLCILCAPPTERVLALCRTTDGFALAETDLRLRGSGELLGTAQSGFGELRALDPVEDFELLLRARQAVKEQACRH